MGDFFDKDKEEEKTVEKIKVGEKEYSQEDLSKLVGLGETAQEYETKWNRKISEFYPDYTQKSQKLAEIERQETERTKLEEERKQRELDDKAKSGTELSPEETRQLAIQQARNLGLFTRDEFSQEVNKAVANALAAKDLLEDINSVISEATEIGQPQTTQSDLLKFMEESGVKNPNKAYKLMFETELDKWKEEKLKSITPSGMTTQIGSTAGGKTPPPAQPITRDNLSSAIRESLTRSKGI